MTTAPDGARSLVSHVADHIADGCFDCSRSLGIVTMPIGYALMQNADQTHFYWLREDGVTSAIHWNRWSVYRWAKNDALSATD